MTDTTTALLSEQEIMIRDSARKVATEVVATTAAERDRTSAWPRDEPQAPKRERTAFDHEERVHAAVELECEHLARGP